MPEYIDADALIRFMNERHKTLVDVNGWYDQYTSGYEDAITDVEEAPIVDAVEVVRCKDCEWHCPNSAASVQHCTVTGMRTEDDDFCSYGKRRADGHEKP